MMQRLAIIDLGTNTFHLLIAEVYSSSRYQIIHREKIAVKLGRGGINENVIQADALDRAINALKNFKIILKQFPEIKVYTFGTSALRNANNAREVITEIKKATDIDVSIISGDDEAEFIYKGVRFALDLGVEPSLIMDIGGGSVEFILANRDKIFWKKSIEIGAQRLLEKFQKHDPIRSSEISELDEYFIETLRELNQVIKKFLPKTLVGSSGTFDTLSEIYCIQNSIPINETDPETPLTLESFSATYHALITKNRAERLTIPGMIEMRVDMIVVACCLIRHLLEKHEFKNIRVSSYSLKEGVLANLLEKEK